MLDAAAQLLRNVRTSGRVVLTGPEGPDGDSIGACLALQRLLGVVAPEVEVVVAGDPGYRYAFLPGAAGMVADASVPEADGVVILDGDRRRLPAPITAIVNRARWTGLIDHHRSTDTAAYDVAVFDAAAESTCGLVRGLARAWDVPIDRELAVLLYTGIIFDTGGFRYSNTHASTHLVAAELLATGIDHASIMLKVLVERRPEALRLLAGLLSGAQFLAGGRVTLASCTRQRMREIGAIDADLEGVVDHLQHVEGVELAAVLVEKEGGRVKVSLRSRGRVDVAALAHSLHDGGGGHAKAAGVVLSGSPAEVEARLRDVLIAAVS
jgi:phosphoesterase RecJ-like protein